jgi:hypothetical protein
MRSYDPLCNPAVPTDGPLDSYLNLAETVLGQARRPLSPREILDHAYADK